MLQKTNNRIMLGDKAYSVGKKLVQIYIPAFSALYFGLGNIWGFPSVEQIVGSAAVIATFIGVCLGLSSSQYEASGAKYDGNVVVTPTEDKLSYSLELNGDPEEIQDKEAITFKVVPGQAPPVAPKVPIKKA